MDALLKKLSRNGQKSLLLRLKFFSSNENSFGTNFSDICVIIKIDYL